MHFNSNTGLKPAVQVGCSVCTDSGVYYAEIKVPGHREPVRVALHGVTTASQAAQALESFARLCLAGAAA